MPRILTCGVDLDGVCANFTKRFTQVANQLFGSRCPVESGYNDNQSSWKFEDWYPITHAECKSVWEEIYKTTNFWESLELISPQSWKYFKDTLCNNPNVDIYFITSREQTFGKSVVQQSIQWLERHGWNNAQVIVSNRKHTICKNMNIKFFIDDNAENIIKIKFINSMCHVYIMDYLYNNEADVALDKYKNAGFKRIPNLQIFTDDITNYSKELISNV